MNNNDLDIINNKENNTNISKYNKINNDNNLFNKKEIEKEEENNPIKIKEKDIKGKINMNTIQSFNNEIQFIRNQIKEKSENIINTINTINQITKKKPKSNENYKKALLLSINSGFFKPRKMFNIYKSSPYFYKNIKKEVMLKKYLSKMEKELIRLNYFILQHVSIIYFIYIYYI